MTASRRAVLVAVVVVITLLLGLFTTVTFAAAPSTDKKTAAAAAAADKDDTFNAREHTDWGTYYDPKNVFCGEFDCYRILGFDFESFGRSVPSTKEITKRYRSLSREWHPDKSRHKHAKDRFVKIARAYEVLTDKAKRDEYDFLRYNQEAYFQKYGASVLWQYAPKTDFTIIVILLLTFGSAFTWLVQKSRWQKVADRLIKAALEDWSPSQGGSPESKVLREHALQLLSQQEAAEESKENNSSTTNGTTTPSKKEKKKVSGKDRKRQEQEALKPIIVKLVGDMHDFGGGFHKPTWRDLLVVQLGIFPVTAFMGLVWNANYYLRRLQSKELNDHEQEVLTKRAVGRVIWETATPEERQVMIQRHLWILPNLAEWKEEQEVKKLSAREQKEYNKLKKKGIKPSLVE